MTDFLFAIVSHTPPQVWGVLALLVAIGLNQARTRDVAPTRVIAVPAALGVYSLWSASSAFAGADSAMLLAAWLGGLALGAASNRALDLPRRCSANADGSFRIEGSFAPLALMLCVFLTRYVNGIATALHPALVGSPGWVIVATLVFAFPAGLFVARSRKVWATRRIATAAPAA
jgi:hypothetical protein